MGRSNGDYVGRASKEKGPGRGINPDSRRSELLQGGLSAGLGLPSVGGKDLTGKNIRAV